MENHNHHSVSQPGQPDSRSYAGLIGAAIMVGLIAGFYVLREHWQHALGDRAVFTDADVPAHSGLYAWPPRPRQKTR